jgi:hypothetical protein
MLEARRPLWSGERERAATLLSDLAASPGGRQSLPLGERGGFHFFLCQRLPIGSAKVLRDEHKCTAAGSDEIKQRPNKDENQNEDTEKNEDPKLL